MKSGSLLRKLILWVNALAAGSLIVSDMAFLINPSTTLVPAFFGLGFLPILGLNLLFLGFWVIFKMKYALVSAVAIVFSIPTFNRHFQPNASSAVEDSNLKVISFNVRLFDLYNWSSNKDTRDNIINYLKDENADVICLQEYFNTSDPKYFETLGLLLKENVASYYHEEFTAIMHGGVRKFGIATLSKYPIAKRGRVVLDTASHNIAIYTDIVKGGDTIRVFNFHLASIHLTAMEREIEEHIERSEQQKQWDDLKALVRKLAGGFKRRSNQAHVIARYIKESPYPVIVCGDLNDTPASYAYASLRGELNDAFMEHGKGMGSTYIGYYPSLRIDYLFHIDALELKAFETADVKLSDHRPLVAHFKI